MVELVAASPELEEELANANFALDYIGQARMFYTYAGEIEGAAATKTISRSCATPGVPQPAARRAAERSLRRRDRAAVPVRAFYLHQLAQ